MYVPTAVPVAYILEHTLQSRLSTFELDGLVTDIGHKTVAIGARP